MSAPEPPTIRLRPKCTDGTITFLWQQPNSANPIISYTLHCESAVGGTVPSDVTITDNLVQNMVYSLSNLTNGVEYTFSIYATDSDSQNSSSVTFRSVEPGNKPEPPQNMYAYAIADTSNALIVWDGSPNSNSATIKWYVVRGYPIGSYSNPRYGTDGTGRSITLSYESNIPFKFKVSAVNDPGYSIPVFTNYINFSPEYLNSSSQLLIMWSDGSILNGTPGDLVNNWSNRGDSSYIMATASFSNTNTYYPRISSTQLNSNNVVSFLASDPDYSIPQSICVYGPGSVTTLPDFYTFFSVSRQLGTTNNVVFGSEIDAIGYSNGYKNVVSIGGDPDTVPSGSISSDSAWDIWTCRRDSSSNFVFRWNGSNSYEGTSPNTISALNYNGLTSSTASDCEIAEVLVYSNALNIIDMNTVEGYLAWKWGLQDNLPSDHPFKNYNPGPLGSNTPRPPSSNADVIITFTPNDNGDGSGYIRINISGDKGINITDSYYTWVGYDVQGGTSNDGGSSNITGQSEVYFYAYNSSNLTSYFELSVTGTTNQGTATSNATLTVTGNSIDLSTQHTDYGNGTGRIDGVISYLRGDGFSSDSITYTYYDGNTNPETTVPGNYADLTNPGTYGAVYTVTGTSTNVYTSGSNYFEVAQPMYINLGIYTYNYQDGTGYIQGTIESSLNDSLASDSITYTYFDGNTNPESIVSGNEIYLSNAGFYGAIYTVLGSSGTTYYSTSNYFEVTVPAPPSMTLSIITADNINGTGYIEGFIDSQINDTVDSRSITYTNFNTGIETIVASNYVELTTPGIYGAIYTVVGTSTNIYNSDSNYFTVASI